MRGYYLNIFPTKAQSAQRDIKRFVVLVSLWETFSTQMKYNQYTNKIKSIKISYEF